MEYTTPLMIAGNGDAALSLPMPKTKLSRRDITISVVARNMPAPAVGGLGDKRFEAAQAVWVVESHDDNITPSENVLVAMPGLPDVVVTTENYKGDQFFVASVKTGNLEQNSAPKMPDHWRIVWDASGSRAQTDIQQARRLLESLPEKATFDLHVFRNDLEAPKKFSSKAQLLKAVDKLVYDGGTDFSCLNKLASQKFNGTTLFFTDGMDTMKGALPQFGVGSVAVMSGSARDVSAMRKICGGRAINLDIVNGQDAVGQILSAPPVASTFEGTGITDIEGIGSVTVGRVTVLGRVQNSATTGILKLSDGRSLSIDINTNDITNGKTLAAAWAANRIDDLSPRAEDNHDELLALGRKFSIVSPVTSLIVFESIDQWLEYEIEPPETLVDIHQQWIAKRPSESKKAIELEERKEDWIANLKDDWEDRIEWWETKFKYVKPKCCDDCDVYEEDCDDCI